MKLISFCRYLKKKIEFELSLTDILKGKLLGLRIEYSLFFPNEEKLQGFCLGYPILPSFYCNICLAIEFSI